MSKLGLLGSPLAGDVTYLYEQIRAFRANYAVVVEHGSNMPSAELAQRLTLLLNIITSSEARADQTIQALSAFANVQFRPWFAKRWRIGQPQQGA